MKKFTKTTWRLLQERLDMILAGGTPKWTRKRTFFYKCRLSFQTEWNLIEVDLANPDSAWGTSVNSWALKHCAELGIKAGRFWEVLSKLNIWPHERGVCFRPFGEDMKEGLVNHETKDDIMKNCSFIIVNEKETLNKELWAALNESGYKGTIIAMGGHNTGTVQSIAADVADELQRIKAENFYILSLHDLDLDGLVMLMTLRKWLPWVIDIGINRGFLKFNGIDKDQFIWERRISKKDIPMLREFVKKAPEYDEEDLATLHGEKTGPKRWQGKRIEIDSVFAKYGVEPFFKYLLEKIKDVPCWDLTRIGIDKQELDEGRNLFDNARDDFNAKVGRAYGEKIVELSETGQRIREVVNDNLKLPAEMSELKNKHVDEKGSSSFLRRSDEDREKYWTYKDVTVKQVDEIYDRYPTEKDYKEEYQSELETEVNEKLTCWKGDVSTAAKDIEETVDDLQSNLDSDKEDDKDLEKFKDDLDELDWGESELKEIELPDPFEKVDGVIEALYQLKREIREEIQEVNQ